MTVMILHRRLSLSVVGVAAVCLASCKDTPPQLTGTTPTEPTAYSASALPAPSSPPMDKHADDAFPLSDDQIRAIVNPSNAPEYIGPTGVIEGTVHVTGDKPLLRNLSVLPDGCERAQKVLGPIYRAGPKGELADALVGVIGVQGFVRPSREDKVVIIRDCVIEPTVIDLSLGQRLMVGSADDAPYMPQTPTKQYVKRIALKGQSPVPLFFTQPAAYAMSWIVGQAPEPGAATVTVFVIPSALHAVTSLDGTYRITGVPVGKAHVTASHLGMPESGQDVDIEAGMVTKVDLRLI